MVSQTVVKMLVPRTQRSIELYISDGMVHFDRLWMGADEDANRADRLVDTALLGRKRTKCNGCQRGEFLQDFSSVEEAAKFFVQGGFIELSRESS